MKKILATFLSLVIAFTLVGCETTDQNGDTGDDQVSVALLIGNLGDLSFNDSAYEGLQRAEEELDINFELVEYGEDPTKYEPALLETADAGHDMIIGSSTLQEVYENNAGSYPDTTFVLFDSTVDYTDGAYPNIYSIVYLANEASYLGGYLMASLSETGILGFLGGTDQPIISDFLLGYIQGAQEANPDIKVTTAYVGSWTDAAKGKELSIGMVNQGADSIFGVAGGAGVGAIEVGAEQGIDILGVDSDQSLVFEAEGNQAFADAIVTSVLKNVGDSLYRAVDLYIKGELEVGSTDNLGITENAVGLADNEYYQDKVPAELRAELAELADRITSGDITVDTAYGKTNEEVSAIRDAVRP